MDLVIRPARAGDAPLVADLLAPEIAAGHVLPRSFEPHAFLVADAGGAVVGCVALRPWTSRVVELGALVASLRGAGVGTALVEAAVARAATLGFDVVVALSAERGFFERCGFAGQADAPWARARGLAAVSVVGMKDLDRAVANKARRSCASCARLGACSQVMLTRRVLSATRRAVA